MPHAVNFGDALQAIKDGHKVSRDGWNGKGMYLFLVSLWTFKGNESDVYPNSEFIAIKAAGDNITPWLASQQDMLADDWMIVE